jgi:hypothetical protein
MWIKPNEHTMYIRFLWAVLSPFQIAIYFIVLDLEINFMTFRSKKTLEF